MVTCLRLLSTSRNNLMEICLRSKNNDKKNQNIGELLRIGKGLLKKNGSRNAEQESILLLSYLLNKEKSDIFLNRDFQVSALQTRQYYDWIDQRIEGVPIQYITGFQNFMGLEFATKKGVFIPRPETEILVEQVIEIIEMMPMQKELNFLDLGTGSGVIPITICSYFQKKGVTINFLAIDISRTAIELAHKNAQMYNCHTHIKFLQGELFKPLKELKQPIYLDGIISNPPYIDQADWGKLPDEVRFFEPAEALWGGAKGIELYKRIISESPVFLKPNGFLALEIGFRQKKDISMLLAGNADFQNQFTTFRDYFQHDRGIIAFKKY